MASQESLNVELGEHDEDLSASLNGSISRLQNLLHNDLPWLHHLEEAVELDSMLLRLRLWKTDIKQDEYDTLSKVGRVSPHLHSATHRFQGHIPADASILDPRPRQCSNSTGSH